MDVFSPEFLRVVHAFDTYRLRYIIVGGFAVNWHGYSRATGDVDIYLEDSTINRASLIDALDSLGYGRFDELRHMPMLAGFCEIIMDDGIYADLMTQIKGLPKEEFAEHFSMAPRDTIDGIEVAFLHLNHLIQSKEATGRPKDLQDLIELRKIKDAPGS